MDFLKTLLIYMVALLSASTAGEVQATPPPASSLPTAYVTYAPTRVPTLAPTLVPTATPSPTPTVYTTLYVGDRGENVKRLQRRLTELGYLNDTIDGVFGQKTKRAVERFQYYNGLNNDGVAGQSTQYMLYESRSVIYAPPDITQRPTATPTPYVQRQVYVPVYYVSRSGAVLARTGINMYSSGTIYADNGMVSSDYVLVSAGSVYVYLNGQSATPASVTFTYDRRTTPAPTTAAPVTIPVYYMTENNAILLVTNCSLARGTTSAVYAQNSLVDSRYALVSASSVNVYVNSLGTATPASVTFRYRDTYVQPTTTATPAPIAYYVYYLTEYEETLYTDIVYLDRGRESTVYAVDGYVPNGYVRVSAASVNVNVTQYGDASPAMARFTYRKPATTAPTTAPTTVPTAEPTPQPIAYNVYYLDEQEGVLYNDIVYLDCGRESTVYANDSLVPQGYVRLSDASIQVSVTSYGLPSPTVARFIYRKPVVVTDPPVIVTDPPVIVTDPPVIVTDPPVIVTDPPVIVTDPPVIVTNPPPSSSASPSGVLLPGGTTINVNGASSMTPWYKNDGGEAYIALERLTELAGAIPVMSGGEIAWKINGHIVIVPSVGDSLGLTIDGDDRAGLGFVVSDRMYLSQSALERLGMNVSVEGDALVLSF